MRVDCASLSRLVLSHTGARAGQQAEQNLTRHRKHGFANTASAMLNLIPHNYDTTCISRSACLIVDIRLLESNSDRVLAPVNTRMWARASSYVHAQLRQLTRATRAHACISHMNTYISQSQGCIPTFEHRCTRRNGFKKSRAQVTWTLPLCISPDECQTWFLPTWFPLLRDTMAQVGPLELGARGQPLKPDCKRSWMALDRFTPCTVHHAYTVYYVYAYNKYYT